MNSFEIVPITKKESIQIKKSGYDELSNEIIREVATGLGPCRVSLQPFVPGEDLRILLSYSPFSTKNVYKQYGPIYLHANDVEEYDNTYRFPPKIKNDTENFPLTLIGYNSAQMMVHTERVGNKDVEILIEDIFKKHSRIEFLHARNSEACCYICKIVRAK